MALEKEDVLYQERVPLAGSVWGLIGLGLALLLGGLVRALLGGVSESERPGLLVGAATILGLGLVAWNYRAVEIRVTRRAFQARYGLLNRTVIPLADVVDCRPMRSTFGRYLGVGLRLGLDGSWAYTTSFGPAVEVLRRSRRPFVVSTNRPQELCQAVTAAVAGDRM